MNFLSDIVEKINKLLYVKPEASVSKEFIKANIVKTRKQTALLLFNVLAGKVSVLEALKNFPKNSADESVNVCFHILVHYDADEDIRKNDEAYREEQDEFILNMAQILQNGESLPINIINEYNEFYKDETLIYPEINKETVISRLKKFINT